MQIYTIMEVMNDPIRQEMMVLCCICGIGIEPNSSNMCVACLRTQIDITENIPKQATIHFCKGCNRYLQPPVEWIYAALESRELLTLCLKKLKGLNRVKLIDAGFVWTEPHSMRLKVKLTVQAEVMGGAVLQQVFIVEYIVNQHMCDDCHRIEAKDYWRTLVQVRQRAINKKTFYYLEQLILKYKAHEQTLGIKPIHEGLDFFFANEAAARKMVDFLSSVVPCRYHQSKKLISHDIHSNIYNYKFTYSVEIVPVSRDSIVCLPKKLSHQLGGISPICLVYKMTNTVHLIDVSSGQVTEVNSTLYWRHTFNSICDPKQLIEYTVMDIEPVKFKDRKFFPGQGTVSNKHIIADVWLVKSCELGINNTLIHSRTHLGQILKPGDTALGYSLNDNNINDKNFEMLNKDFVPDVILVKKNYTHDRIARRRMRAWKLKHMINDGDNTTTDNKSGKLTIDHFKSWFNQIFLINVGSRNVLLLDSRGGNYLNLLQDLIPEGKKVVFIAITLDVLGFRIHIDYYEFLEDIEEDREMRKNINIFRDRMKTAPANIHEETVLDYPQITLEEMLDDLTIDDMGELQGF